MASGFNDACYDIPDPTDWLNTPLASLAPVENALRCQVCKDFYKTPMITSCSHTFCSLCIRHCLSSDGKCPVCRAADQASKLRTNWVVEELVDAFQTARPSVLDYARAKRSTVVKRKVDATDLDLSETDIPQKKRRSSSRINSKSQDQNKYYVPDNDGVDEDYQPDDGLVACPVCNARVKLDMINHHLDRCTGPPEDTYAQSDPVINRGAMRTISKPVNKLERLPEVSYSLFKDNALRKKLGDLGISTAGSRAQLEHRHREWLNLWNANCDAAKPRRKADLLQDLQTWERTQGVRLPSRNIIDSGTQITSKDFDATAWASKHDQSFQQLIASARQRPVQGSVGAYHPDQTATKHDENDTITESAADLPNTAMEISSSEAKPENSHQA